MINIVLLVMIEVVLILGTTISPPKKLILAHTGIIGGFIHLIIIVQHPPWCHNSEMTIQLVLLVVINLVFQMMMVKVVWLLEPPTFSTKNMIFVLMVVILYHILLGIIQPRAIPTETGPIIYYIKKGRINLALLVMVEVVLVLRKPTSTPIRVNLVRDRNDWFFGHPIVTTMNHPCHYLGSGIIQLVMLVVIHLVLLLDMIKVVWVLVPPPPPPNKLIVGLMVAIFCYLWVGIIKISIIRIK